MRCLSRFPFGIAFDVDGVLLRGKSVIPNAVKALSLVRQLEIPFGVATNGGGITEADFAVHLNRLGLPLLREDQICLAHSPLQALVPQLHDELVVCFGRKEPVRVAKSYGFKFAVSPEQFCSVFHLFPFEQYNEPVSDELRHKILTQPAAAAFVMTDPIIWGRDIQLICDLAAPCMPSGGLPDRQGQKLRVLFAQDDFQWSEFFFCFFMLNWFYTSF